MTTTTTRTTNSNTTFNPHPTQQTYPTIPHNLTNPMNPNPTNPMNHNPTNPEHPSPPTKPTRRGRPTRTPKPPPRRRPSQTFSAEQKVQAVLAAWTEKLSQTEICRQMQINYVTFQHWQTRAMDGMLQALENQLRLGDTTVLGPRLRKLLERGRPNSQPRLDQRLRQIQLERDKDASA